MFTYVLSVYVCRVCLLFLTNEDCYRKYVWIMERKQFILVAIIAIRRQNVSEKLQFLSICVFAAPCTQEPRLFCARGLYNVMSRNNVYWSHRVVNGACITALCCASTKQANVPQHQYAETAMFQFLNSHSLRLSN